jgi:hypothetical protein
MSCSAKRGEGEESGSFDHENDPRPIAQTPLDG